MEYTIVENLEDGEIRVLGDIRLNFTPTIGVSLAYIDLDSSKRAVYEVQNISYPIKVQHKNKNDGTLDFEQIRNVAPILGVKKLFEEDV